MLSGILLVSSLFKICVLRVPKRWLYVLSFSRHVIDAAEGTVYVLAALSMLCCLCYVLCCVVLLAADAVACSSRTYGCVIWQSVRSL